MTSKKPDDMANNKNMAMISVKNLRVGMYVSQLDKPWEESPFMFQGFLLENEAQILKVKTECSYVYIDIDKQSNLLPKQSNPNSKISRRPTSSSKSKAKPNKNTYKSKPTLNKSFNRLKDIIDSKKNIEDLQPPDKPNTFEEEIKTAQHIHVKSSLVLKKFMDNVRNGGSINPEVAKITVYECMQSVLRSPDAMMLMTHLKDKDTYTWRHSMNVCIFAISLGRFLNLNESELLTLGLCGMLHDIGKLRIPLEILNKPNNLDANELKIIRSHTTHGKDILLSSPSLVADISEAAYSHHEKLDGSGYPRGLTDKQIPAYAKIVAIADMYDALTSDRVFRQSKTHFEAINIMIAVSGQHLDEILVNAFIQCIGAYPAGSAVEMNTGELAIVVETNPQQKLRPKIMVISDVNRKPQKERIINLVEPKYTNKDNPYSVRTIIRPDTYAMDINKYYKYGVIQRGLASS